MMSRLLFVVVCLSPDPGSGREVSVSDCWCRVETLCGRHVIVDSIHKMSVRRIRGIVRYSVLDRGEKFTPSDSESQVA